MIGIYCIKNKINGKEYIGQSINIKKRIHEHKKKALDYPEDISYNSILHQAIRKYGWESFEIIILEKCSYNLLDEREKFYIQSRNTLSKNGYNISAGGQSNKLRSDKHFCKCGARKSITAKQCLECYKKFIKTEIIVDFELIVRCLDSSMEQVAKELNYKSGNGLKKIISSQGFPSNRKDMLIFFEKQTGKKHFKEKEKEEKEQKRLDNIKKSAAKPVHQYSKDGQYIKSFSSFNNAAKEVGTHSGPISEVVRGKRKTAGGFIWKLEKD